MGDTYYLKNTETGYVHGKFVVDKAEDYFVEGAYYRAVGWAGDTNQPCDWHFVADTYCKWDSCTHWYFYGENYDPDYEESETDSYYHLCTEYTFNDHIRLMCFVWKLVADIMTELRKGEEYYDADITKHYIELEETRKLVDLMLDGYVIVKVEE